MAETLEHEHLNELDHLGGGPRAAQKLNDEKTFQIHFDSLFSSLFYAAAIVRGTVIVAVAVAHIPIVGVSIYAPTVVIRAAAVITAITEIVIIAVRVKTVVFAGGVGIIIIRVVIVVIIITVIFAGAVTAPRLPSPAPARGALTA